MPLKIDILQSHVTSGAIANPVLLSIRAEILSGPVDLASSVQVGEQTDDVILQA